ncbi:MAG: hypothetical protein AAF184_08540 [Pseudomonadota bacterium]
MASQEQQVEEQAEKDGPEAGQQIDKIREIIFGVQMRDYEERFKLLERQLTDRTEQLGKQLAQRLESLEQQMRADVGRLGDQLASEARQRGEERDVAAAALRDADAAIKARLESVAKSGNEEIGEVREVIQRNSADFHDALMNLSERLDKALAQTADTLEDVKVSRDDLAGLLSDVARRLRRENDSA